MYERVDQTILLGTDVTAAGDTGITFVASPSHLRHYYDSHNLHPLTLVLAKHHDVERTVRYSKLSSIFRILEI